MTSGQASGHASGQAPGHASGRISGQVSGEAAGEVAGLPLTGPAPGCGTATGAGQGRRRGLVVHKYGGSSLATPQQVRRAAARISAARARGERVVVVVSAQGDTTDHLLARAAAFTGAAPPGSALRESDQLLATGEIASAALTAMALHGHGTPAVSLTGGQAGLRVRGRHGAGLVDRLDPGRILDLLDAGTVPVVAGFQGVDARGETVTLGRGGSDTTAVALAAGLNAERCLIHTDVPGVFSADPRVVAAPRLLPRVPVDVMAEMAFTGARVLHSRAVELAALHHVPTLVLSSATEGPGTVITGICGPALETAPAVTAITHDADVVRVLLRCADTGRDLAPDVLGILARYALPVDLVARSGPAEEEFRMGFATRRGDFAAARPALASLALAHGGELRVDEQVAKVTVVGTGLANRPESTARMLSALARAGIATTWILTSQIRASALIPQKRLEEAVRVLHTAFALDVGEQAEQAEQTGQAEQAEQG
ncbi:aspartate kinase [Streptomyces sp. p1417]|uniref:Aspartokinase n=1 Tax=Streptomyces typhae TaxID=2681492 RepID=A0A6L6X400_9ACTN|nr:aspartate kinase [Streptomyces typhae]MVO88522.1 aspartate kinase [Streptomyces typhae]